ncbi:hypothetical protein [Pseudogemmobacter humi]|uniref:Uncharacterized protein n=1 Tax=Pseudogemmobacter humi TaxID=2483812 RepID=A0A3P5WND1_9RHOB|nr:hypothetical protein [Pseudogemmobacter humi]VDC22472.1 hypothetical protein XINFAN_00795 [Pseudogemmobacter humi]
MCFSSIRAPVQRQIRSEIIGRTTVSTTLIAAISSSATACDVTGDALHHDHRATGAAEGNP